MPDEKPIETHMERRMRRCLQLLERIEGNNGALIVLGHNQTDYHMEFSGHQDWAAMLAYKAFEALSEEEETESSLVIELDEDEDE